MLDFDLKYGLFIIKFALHFCIYLISKHFHLYGVQIRESVLVCGYEMSKCTKGHEHANKKIGNPQHLVAVHFVQKQH